MRSTRAIINLSKLERNIKIIKKQLNSNTAIMAIVKANAYGHGIVEISKHALNAGAVALGIAIPEEGITLRHEGIDCEILVLGGIDVHQIDAIVDYNLSVCLFSSDMAKLLNQRAKAKNKCVKVHVKIDSGMGRIGVRDRDDILQLCQLVANMNNLRLEGIFTHFACADECDNNYSLIQLDHFKEIVSAVNNAKIYPKWIHAANTDAIFNFPESHFNMVRSGIGIYGYSSEAGVKSRTGLEPILSWHTKVVHIKEVEPGCSVSYGRSYVARNHRRVATLPVGYGDGYNRLLSNRGWVLIKGMKAPILGNICMDQMMVDITDISDVVIGEDVVLIGQQGNESISANDLAKLCHTISYEVLTNINMRVPRVHVEDVNE